MSSVYRLSGLPPDASFKVLINALRRATRRAKIRFFLGDLTFVPSTNSTDAIITFNNPQEADVAIQLLTKESFSIENTYCDLTAVPVPEENNQKPMRKSDYGHNPKDQEFGRSRGKSFERAKGQNFDHSKVRDRSRSPLSKEASKLDIELEVLIKQRQVIEEKKRLLLEKKKLDCAEIPEEHQGHKMPYVERVEVPLYNAPRKVIYGQMQKVIADNVHKKRVSLFHKLCNVRMRQRIVLIIAAKGLHPTNHSLPAEAIVKLYREKHPENSDKGFVNEIVDLLKKALWPDMYYGNSGNLEFNYFTESDDENDVELVENQQQPAVVVSDDIICVKDSKEEDSTHTEVKNDTNMEPVKDNSALNNAVEDDWVKGDTDWDDQY